MTDVQGWQPMGWISPCGGCRYLIDRGDTYYVKCGYFDENPPPLLPFAFLSAWNPFNGLAGEMTRKSVEGPFSENARRYGCSVFLPDPPSQEDR
jgi:hypothetical protein